MGKKQWKDLISLFLPTLRAIEIREHGVKGVLFNDSDPEGKLI
jgi:hypothetical protein